MDRPPLHHISTVLSINWAAPLSGYPEILYVLIIINSSGTLVAM